MATSVTDLSITQATVNVGSAATFRETINTNFTNYKSTIETKINSQVKPAVTELQSKVGEWNTSSYGTITNFVNGWPSGKSLMDVIGNWDVATYGTIRNRLASPSTAARVFVATGNAGSVRSNALINDLICEVYTV